MRGAWRAVIVVTMALVGAGAGMVAASALGPTNAEVRYGARSLVLPEVEIVGQESGYEGNWPTKGPYVSSVDTRGGGDVVAKESSVRRHALRRGWGIAAMERLPNAVVLRLTKGHLEARVSIRLADDSASISVEETAVDRRRARGAVFVG